MSNKYDTKDIIHIKDGNLEYLKFRILEKYKDKVRHAITLRHGGISENEYYSLNFRSIGADSKENVKRNLNIFCNSVGINANHVFKGKQSHTDNILILNNDNKDMYSFDKFCNDEFDGYITDKKNIATLITTADCNPIIFYDPIQNVVANVHSGWKGTVKHIYLKAVNEMEKKFGCETGNIIVCIGPSICKCCFDSEEETFKNIFTNIWKDEENYISYEMENPSRFHIDLHYLIKNDLINRGIKEENIAISEICTHCNSEDFFSYRRYTKENKKEYGTGATIVEII